MAQRGGSGQQHEGCRRLKTEILIQMDGLLKSGDRVFVLAGTNIPWDLDDALLRRLEKRIYVPLPDKSSREQMLRMHLEKRSKGLDFGAMGEALEGYSGSDIKMICKEACMRPLRKILHKLEYEKLQLRADTQADPVNEEDMAAAMRQVKPSPNMGNDKYVKWFEQYGSY
jgi:katanin p60 ATPase-containing subunit A1